MIRVDVSGLSEAEKAMPHVRGGRVRSPPVLARTWRARWPTTPRARWPLRRRTGTLRASLTWASATLGRGGVFESSPNQLTFGTNVFYSRFAQFGTKRQRATPLIHIDEAQHSEQLTTWLRDRALAASGLVVE